MPRKKKSTTPDRIELAARGLVYVSETDSEVEPFRDGKRPGSDLANFREAIAAAPDEEIVEGDAAVFFRRLGEVQDWHGERDRANAEGFRELYEVLRDELSGLRLFRVGHIRLTLYVVGVDRKGRLRGVSMHAVET